jgi:hypothetical protein
MERKKPHARARATYIATRGRPADPFETESGFQFHVHPPHDYGSHGQAALLLSMERSLSFRTTAHSAPRRASHRTPTPRSPARSCPSLNARSGGGGGGRRGVALRAQEHPPTRGGAAARAASRDATHRARIPPHTRSPFGRAQHRQAALLSSPLLSSPLLLSHASGPHVVWSRPFSPDDQTHDASLDHTRSHSHSCAWLLWSGGRSSWLVRTPLALPLWFACGRACRGRGPQANDLPRVAAVVVGCGCHHPLRHRRSRQGVQQGCRRRSARRRPRATQRR